MKNIVEGFPSQSEIDKCDSLNIPNRKEEKCITEVFYYIDGKESHQRFNGKLKEREVERFTRSRLLFSQCQSIVVAGLTYYTQSKVIPLALRLK